MKPQLAIACGAFALFLLVVPPLGGIDESIFRVGHGVTAPRPLNSPDPEYSDEARKAGLQGKCVLSLVVDSEGKPQDVKVSRSLGKGLDEKSVEAIQKWSFEPARKDGKPVAVRINVVVTFRIGKTAMTPLARAALQRAQKANEEFRRTMWERVHRVQGDTPPPLCRSTQRGEDGEATHFADLDLEVDPKQYWLESITFSGNTTLSNATALRALFPIKDGERFDVRAVSDGLQQLRTAYGSQGFIAFKDTVHADVDGSRHRIALQIKCEEGRQFVVDHVNMAGLDEQTFQKLRKTLYVKPGDIYNERLASLWLEKNFHLVAPDSSIRDRIKLDIDERRGSVGMSYDFTPCSD